MALCPSCGALTESDPCHECGTPLNPGPSIAAMIMLEILWFVSVLGVVTGVRIFQGPTPVRNPASGAYFFIPLALALIITLFWIRRAQKRAKQGGG